MSSSIHRSTKMSIETGHWIGRCGDLDSSSFAGIGGERPVRMGTTESSGRSIGDHN